MLLKLYYLYQKSAKRTRDLKAYPEIYDKVITKPCKSSGTRWIVHKVNAMEIILQNYGIFMTHLESLFQTDSQALRELSCKALPDVGIKSNVLYIWPYILIFYNLLKV